MIKKQIVKLSILALLSLTISCKTDHSKKKDAEYLFWNASLKTENNFIKQAVREINEEKGESLVVERYNSPQTKEEVLNFFAEYTGNMEIAKSILHYSVKYDVPPTLSFALSKAESSFNPKAVNKNRASIDRGLFQLNSSTFPKLTNSDFFDIDTNSAYGIEFIRWCLDTGTNEVSALAMYNAGSGRVSGRGTPRQTLNYISKVLANRESLLDDFNSEMNSLFRIDAQSSKLVKDITIPLARP